ncbi:MAG: nucleoside deaminase [Rhodospirillaceae bacterium]
MTDHARFMRRAIELAAEHSANGEGGPFGAVVVLNGEIIGEGWNQVVATNDPTAHAEMVAIRAACLALGRFSLEGADLYTSCEPCPMCLAGIYWARLNHIYYANDRAGAAAIGFDDADLYAEVALPPDQRRLPMTRILPAEAAKGFAAWLRKTDRVLY